MRGEIGIVLWLRVAYNNLMKETGPEKSSVEIINLSELFEDRKKNPAFDFKWGPFAELNCDGKTVVYRIAKNEKGIEWCIVVGAKESDVYEEDENELIKVSGLSDEEKSKITAELQEQVHGKIEYLV